MIVIVANVIFLSNKISFTRLDSEKRREFLNYNSFELRPCLRVLVSPVNTHKYKMIFENNTIVQFVSIAPKHYLP